MKNLVFIHGLLLSGWVFTRMRRYFSKKGYQCFQYNYPTRSKTISQNAHQLKRWLNKNEVYGADMVCHSMGGLVCHAYMEHCNDHENSDQKVVCLGSPFAGSIVARNLSQSGAGRFLLGVQSDSALIGGITNWPGQSRLGVIAGNKNLGIGRLLGLDATNPGDGTVLVGETEITGVSDHIILPVTHSQMTFSTAVFEQTEHFFDHCKFKQIDS